MGSPRPVGAASGAVAVLLACGLAGMRAVAGPASTVLFAVDAVGRAGAGSSVAVAVPLAGAVESAWLLGAA